jgi:hypothetical protein
MNLVRFFDDGFRVGLLVKQGDVHDHVVAFRRHKVRVLRFAADNDQLLTYVDGDADRARRRFLALGKTRGITDAAQQLLEATSA